MTVQASRAVKEASPECCENSETERIPNLAKGVHGYVCLCTYLGAAQGLVDI